MQLPNRRPVAEDAVEGTPPAPARRRTLAAALALVAATTAALVGLAGPLAAILPTGALAASVVDLAAASATASLAATLDGVAQPAQSFSLDYQPSLQTQHLGLYSALTVALAAVGYWILATRQTRGARLFAATLLLAAVRTGVDVLQVVVGEMWAFHRTLVGAALLLQVFVVLVFLRFAGRYADEPRLYGATARTATLAVAGLATVAVLTDPLHGLVVEEFVEVTMPFVHPGAVLGPVGWGLLALTFLVLLTGAGLLARSFTVAEQPDWWSAAMLTMGICLTVVVAVLDFLDQLPLAQFDYGGAALAGFLALTTPALLGHGLRRIEITARESMLRELDDPIVIVDDKRHVVDYTAAAADLLPPDAAGRPFESVLDLVPDWPAVGETTTAEVTRSEIVHDAAADAENAHYLLQTSPVTSETGDVIGYTVRFADVTDLKERTAELARKNEQLDQFANTISQDLREPLRTASEYVEMLEEAVKAAGADRTLDAETVHHYLDTIDRSLERMQHIIDDLLALARDTDPVSDVERVPFGDAARDAWDLVDPDAGRLSVASDGAIHADGECLQRVFENLFRTVFESGGESADRDARDVLGSGVEVIVGLRDDGFHCTASGPGLPDDLEDLTTERADAAAPEQRRLELSIVDHLADAHGWTVSVDRTGEALRFDVAGCTTDPEEPLAGEAA